jgi:hypothetical protein
VQFVLVASVIWGVHQALQVPKSPGPLGETTQLQEALRKAFEKQNGRIPSTEEYKASLDHYLEEEILFREAVRLGLGDGDPIIRRRLIQMMRFFVEDSAAIPNPTTEQLKSWVDANSDKFQQEATIDFSHRFFHRDSPTQEKPFIHGNQFKELPISKVQSLFGTSFTEELGNLPVGQWSKKIGSIYGIHEVLLRKREEAQPKAWNLIENQARLLWLTQKRKTELKSYLVKAKQLYEITPSKP